MPQRVGARERRQRGKAFDRDALAFGMDGDRIGAKVRAEDVAEPHQPAGRAGQRRGKAHRRALFTGKRESNVRTAHGKAAHRLANRVRLGAIES